MREGATVRASSNPVIATETQRRCARCNPGIYRRINRVSFLERTLFTWLGYYPWECVSCRRKAFFRSRTRPQTRYDQKPAS